jgi:peptide/nickel transport system permease protein
MRHPSFVIGARAASGCLLLLLAAAPLSLVWTPWSPYEIDMAGKLQPPSAAALAGHRRLRARRRLAAAGGRAQLHPGGRDRGGHRPGHRHGAGLLAAARAAGSKS